MPAKPRRPKTAAPDRNTASPSPVRSQIRTVPLDAIVVPPRRFRRDLGDVDALALSLHMHGQLAPVIVHQVNDRFHLIAGERRLEATRRLHAAQASSGQAPSGVPGTINVVVRELLPGENPGEIELAENAQRRELSDEEEADALIRLVREDGRDMHEVAALAGRSVGYISKRVRMFEDPTLRTALIDGSISPAQAEELLTLDDDRRAEMLQLVITSGLGSKELREAVQMLGGRGAERRAPAEPEDFDDGFDDEDDDELVAPSGSALGVDDAGRTIRDRPRGLTRQILALNSVLQDLRPFQLKKADDRALRQLWMTLRQLAQAPRVPQPTQFPSLADAESLVRRR